MLRELLLAMLPSGVVQDSALDGGCSGVAIDPREVESRQGCASGFRPVPSKVMEPGLPAVWSVRFCPMVTVVKVPRLASMVEFVPPRSVPPAKLSVNVCSASQLECAPAEV